MEVYRDKGRSTFWIRRAIDRYKYGSGADICSYDGLCVEFPAVPFDMVGLSTLLFVLLSCYWVPVAIPTRIFFFMSGRAEFQERGLTLLAPGGGLAEHSKPCLNITAGGRQCG